MEWAGGGGGGAVLRVLVLEDGSVMNHWLSKVNEGKLPSVYITEYPWKESVIWTKNQPLI